MPESRGRWLAIASVAALAACSQAPPSSSSSAVEMLVRGGGTEPDSLDPQKARSVESQSILRDVCEGLTVLDKTAAVAPGTASSWDLSPDGTTYTFRLRAGARWSNGDPVEAADFVAGLQRLTDPQVASPYAQVVDVIAGATEVIGGRAPVSSLGVTAPDAATVIIKLVHPAPSLPGLLAHPSTCPVHRATLKARGEAFARPGVMVSNGAFVLKEWVPGSHVLLERNHRYWNDAATHLTRVKYLIIPDENAELLRYRAGDIHVTYVVPRGQFDWVRANLKSELHVAPQLTTYFYGFNLDRPPFKGDARIRRALSLVIDREMLTERVLRVGELPAYGWVPPGIGAYQAQSFDYAGKPMAERIREARQLYAASGYSRERPLRFELRYNTGETHTKVAIAIASMWKEALGADVRLVAVEFKSLLQDIDRGDVELFRSSWSGDYNDAYSFAQYFKSDFGINLPHYRSSAYDALLKGAADALDPAHRRELLEAAERQVLADHPLIPIYFYVNKHLVKPAVVGWYDNVMNVTYSKDLALRAGAF